MPAASSAAKNSTAAELRDWPPAGSVAVEVDGLYQHAAEAGLLYKAMRSAASAQIYQRVIVELFAQVELPETTDAQKRAGFGLHPALLGAALHALLTAQTAGCGHCAFLLCGAVCTCRRGALGAMRVCGFVPDGKAAISMLLADAAGAPIGAVQALYSRPAGASQIRSGVER